MTISPPSLPSAAAVAVALPGLGADLLVSSGAVLSPAGLSPVEPATDGAAGFAGWLPEDATPDPKAADPANLDQAAVLATALLWAPAPQLVDAPPQGGFNAPSDISSPGLESAAGQGDSNSPATASSAQLSEPPALTTRDSRRFVARNDQGWPADPVLMTRPPDAGALHLGRNPVPAMPDGQPTAKTPVMPVEVSSRDTSIPPNSVVAVDVPPQSSPPTILAVARGSAAPLEPVNSQMEESSALRPDKVPDVAAAIPAAQPVRATGSDASDAALPAEIAEQTSLPLRPSQPTGRTSGLQAVRKEKIAPSVREALPTPERPVDSSGKIFLSIRQQAGRGESKIVGTPVAKSEASMPSASLNPTHLAEFPASALLLDPARSGFGPVSTVPQVNFSSLGVSDPAIQARDAVASVMRVIDVQEQPAPGTSHVVNLHFDFGPDRLAVRVERHSDGTVQAKFHTDSPELRTALAHEWQQAAAAPENILRLATPEFHAAPRDGQPAGFTADSGQGTPRDQKHGQPADESASRPARAGVRPASPANPTEVPRLRVLPTVQHLQAVA